PLPTSPLFPYTTLFRSFHSPEELIGLTIRRELLWNNKKTQAGPFDIIGDIHGCLDEALELLASLGYTVGNEAGRYSVSHPHGRRSEEHTSELQSPYDLV